MKVPVTRPFTGPEEMRALAGVVESGWLTHGQAVTDFESAVAARVGVRHAVACSNCTTALHLALLLHGIGPGDEVIVPSYTFIATANSVRMVGATPRFVDINIDTFNMSVPTAKAAINERTRAIIVVDQFGLPADIDAIAGVARAANLALIEDAACAIGSRYNGREVGGLDHLTCFSFHPRKLITTGEGGMLTTDDDNLAARARVLVNHGASMSDVLKHRTDSVEGLLSEHYDDVGYNYRMTNLQGAFGCVQMSRLDEILRLRRARAERYGKALSGLPFVIPPAVPAWAEPNWQSYAIRISDDCPVPRNAIAQGLLDAGIACRPAYMACHSQPVYARANPGLRLPNTDRALGSVIILPLFPQMTDDEQNCVVETLSACVSARV